MTQLFGVDLSSIGQGYLTPGAWDQINSACNFVVIQASYGTLRDEQLTNNQTQARRVRAVAGPLGIVWYHFAYPQFPSNTPEASAAFFLDSVGELQPTEAIMLDWEQPYNGDQVQWVLDFDQYIFDRIGLHVGWLYLNQSQESSINWSPVRDRGIKLMLAKYDGSKTDVPSATHWPTVSIKQWTDADIVPGFSGNVDGDTFEGDWADFNAIGLQPPTPPPPATSPTPVIPDSTPTPPAPGAIVQPVVTASPSIETPPATGQPAPTTKLDSLSRSPEPILVRIAPLEQQAVSWLGTTMGGLVLRLAGAFLGWLVAHSGLVQANDVATSVLGLIAGSVVHDTSNPSVPNSPRPKPTP